MSFTFTANFIAIAERTCRASGEFTYRREGDSQAHVVTQVMLDTIDPRLPEVMQYYCENYSPTVAAQLLNKTLQLWHTTSVVRYVTDPMYGQTVEWLVAVLMFAANDVCVAIDQWVLIDTDVPGSTFVVNSIRKSPAMSYVELEAQYPGSVQRLRVAAELDLQGPALHAYVFTTPEPRVVVALPEQLSIQM